MAKLNISQAAKAIGKDRRTLQRHIKQGKLSCEIDSSGHKLIDISELQRVYGEIKEPTAPTALRQSNPESQYVTLILEQRIKYLERQVEELREDKEKLHQDKEAYRQESGKLLQMLETEQQKTQTLLLEDKRGRKGFWSRLFGR